MRKHSLVAGITISLAVMLPSTAFSTAFTEYTGSDGAALANVLASPGSGVNVLSSSFLGNSSSGAASAGFFTDLDFGTIGTTDFTLTDGIVLTSGNANLPLTNTQSDFTGTASGQGDAGLDALLDTHFNSIPGGIGDCIECGDGGFNHVTRDSTVLAFDFTVDSGANAVSMDFIFGTEEFPEYIDSYPEIAAIFVDGVNYAGFADGSILTLTSDTVDSGNYYDNDTRDAAGNTALDIEYDGVSGPLSVLGLLDPTLDVHTIKIAVSDTNDAILDTGLFVANMQSLTFGGIPTDPTPTDPTDPTGPVVSFVGSGLSADDPLIPVNLPVDAPSFPFVIDLGDLGVGIDPSTPIFIDPFVATGYTYESSVNMATIVIPDSFGDGVYAVYGWNGTDYEFLKNINAGEQLNLLAFEAAGYDKLMVDGIEVDAMLDPTDPTAFITGLTFVSGGTITVTQTAIEKFVPDATVPAPGTLALIAASLIGLRIRASRKQA